ncbi:MAG: nucleotidyl transferase AbiEii/AbiGii toxin family protein [Planctomycetota bacterium]|jgi:hypothetical protein
MTDAFLFTREHLEKHKGLASPRIAEQAVHSLELVARLVQTRLAFRFKGGNSLLVLLQDPQRFSMDVDIATGESRERIEACLDAAVRASTALTRWKRRQHLTKPWLPLASFEVYYDSVFDETEDSFIFLDAQLKKTPVPGVRLPVRCSDLFASEEKVEVSTVGGILGDKLLTLGPDTLGIPLGKKKEAQRLKHVFDIATLAMREPDLAEVRATVNLLLKEENELQEKSLTLDEVFRDTLALCRSVVPWPEPPDPGSVPPLLSEVVRGLEPFREHLFLSDYTWQDLQRDLARAAVCFTAVVTESVSVSDFRAALSKKAPHPAEGPCAELAAFHPHAASLWAAVAQWMGGDPLR